MMGDPDLFLSYCVLFSRMQRVVNLAQVIGIPEPGRSKAVKIVTTPYMRADQLNFICYRVVRFP